MFGHEVRLPLWYLCEVFPFLIKMKSTYRFMVMVFLVSGVLVSLGVPGLLGRVGSRARVAVLAVVCVLLLFEPLQPGAGSAPFPLPVERATVPQVYRDLANEPRKGRLIEFPCMLGMEGGVLDGVVGVKASPMVTLNQKVMYFQTVHQWPMGNLDKDNLRSVKTFQNRALRVLSTACMNGSCAVGRAERDAARQLAELGFTTLILHHTVVPSRAQKAVRRYLDTLLTVVREYPKERIVRYRFPLLGPLGK